MKKLFLIAVIVLLLTSCTEKPNKDVYEEPVMDIEEEDNNWQGKNNKSGMRNSLKLTLIINYDNIFLGKLWNLRIM